MNRISKIVFIGAGNVATNLAIALHSKGLNIVQIVSRTINSAKELALKVDADFTDDLSGISQNADLYIFSVTDAALIELSTKISLPGKVVVHTAGTLEMEVLKSISNNYGVFYPLQTFSKAEIIDFEEIPICIESNHKEIESFLINLANLISKNVHLINSDQRKILHVSAVFACNFSSYMYLIAHDILEENGLEFDLIKPLIIRTASKIKTQEPEDAITGPSRRNDTEIINNHLNYLKTNPDYFEIYKLLSNNIAKHFHDNKK